MTGVGVIENSAEIDHLDVIKDDNRTLSTLTKDV